MPDHRYAQFCPIARAAEVLGERWTLLILRELFCGPQRFSDLARRLPGISSSVLAERLGRLEARGIAMRRELPPPAPATLYELTPLGSELEPLMLQLVRFGVRMLDAPRPEDHLEPEWLPMALAAFARREPTPPRRIALRIFGDAAENAGDVAVFVEGGSGGTVIRTAAAANGDAEVTVRLPPLLLLGLATGQLDPEAAASDGQIEIEGDASALRALPDLFDLQAVLARPNPS